MIDGASPKRNPALRLMDQAIETENEPGAYLVKAKSIKKRRGGKCIRLARGMGVMEAFRRA